MSPDLPPLFDAVAEVGPPAERALELARAGCDGGTVVYRPLPDRLEAAVVFAPEVVLRQATAILPICAVGFQNALGVLAPPEVGVHLDWDGTIRVNGARCGALGLIGPDCGAGDVPEWLIVTLDVAFVPASDETGENPDQTALYAEGCGEVHPIDLLSAWLRHTLAWINRWTDGDQRALHSEWSGLAHGLGATVTQSGRTGTFKGVDEDFAMLLETGDGVIAVPLAEMMQRDRAPVPNRDVAG